MSLMKRIKLALNQKTPASSGWGLQLIIGSLFLVISMGYTIYSEIGHEAKAAAIPTVNLIKPSANEVWATGETQKITFRVSNIFVGLDYNNYQLFWENETGEYSYRIYPNHVSFGVTTGNATYQDVYVDWIVGECQSDTNQRVACQTLASTGRNLPVHSKIVLHGYGIAPANYPKSSVFFVLPNTNQITNDHVTVTQPSAGQTWATDSNQSIFTDYTNTKWLQPATGNPHDQYGYVDMSDHQVHYFLYTDSDKEYSYIGSNGSTMYVPLFINRYYWDRVGQCGIPGSTSTVACSNKFGVAKIIAVVTGSQYWIRHYGANGMWINDEIFPNEFVGQSATFNYLPSLEILSPQANSNWFLDKLLIIFKSSASAIKVSVKLKRVITKTDNSQQTEVCSLKNYQNLNIAQIPVSLGSPAGSNLPIDLSTETLPFACSEYNATSNPIFSNHGSLKDVTLVLETDDGASAEQPVHLVSSTTNSDLVVWDSWGRPNGISFTKTSGNKYNAYLSVQNVGTQSTAYPTYAEVKLNFPKQSYDFYPQIPVVSPYSQNYQTEEIKLGEVDFSDIAGKSISYSIKLDNTEWIQEKDETNNAIQGAFNGDHLKDAVISVTPQGKLATGDENKNIAYLGQKNDITFSTLSWQIRPRDTISLKAKFKSGGECLLANGPVWSSNKITKVDDFTYKYEWDLSGDINENYFPGCLVDKNPTVTGDKNLSDISIELSAKTDNVVTATVSTDAKVVSSTTGSYYTVELYDPSEGRGASSDYKIHLIINNLSQISTGYKTYAKVTASIPKLGSTVVKEFAPVLIPIIEAQGSKEIILTDGIDTTLAIAPIRISIEMDTPKWIRENQDEGKVYQDNLYTAGKQKTGSYISNVFTIDGRRLTNPNALKTANINSNLKLKSFDELSITDGEDRLNNYVGDTGTRILYGIQLLDRNGEIINVSTAIDCPLEMEVFNVCPIFNTNLSGVSTTINDFNSHYYTDLAPSIVEQVVGFRFVVYMNVWYPDVSDPWVQSLNLKYTTETLNTDDLAGVTITPTSISVAPSGNQTFTAVPVPVTTADVTYAWTLVGSGSISPTTGPQIIYTAGTANGIATLTVTASKTGSTDKTAVANITIGVPTNSYRVAIANAKLEGKPYIGQPFTLRLYKNATIVEEKTLTISADNNQDITIDTGRMVQNPDNSYSVNLWFFMDKAKTTVGDIYNAYLKSNRHLWRKAGNSITMGSGTDYSLDFTGQSLLSGDIVGNPSDNKQDNYVNVLDFQEWMSELMQTATDGSKLADFDSNGTVNVADFGLLIYHWLTAGDSPTA